MQDPHWLQSCITGVVKAKGKRLRQHQSLRRGTKLAAHAACGHISTSSQVAAIYTRTHTCSRPHAHVRMLTSARTHASRNTAHTSQAKGSPCRGPSTTCMCFYMARFTTNTRRCASHTHIKPSQCQSLKYSFVCFPEVNIRLKT